MLQKEAFLELVGTEFIAMRERSPNGPVTAKSVADSLGWQRSAMSKIESGTPFGDGLISRTNLSLYDYLRIVEFLRDAYPEDHPAVLLLDHFTPKRKRAR